MYVRNVFTVSHNAYCGVDVSLRLLHLGAALNLKLCKKRR